MKGQRTGDEGDMGGIELPTVFLFFLNTNMISPRQSSE